MGNSVSRVVGCFVPSREHDGMGVVFSETLDEGLGHSFCYIRPTLDSSTSSPTRQHSGDYSQSNSSSLNADSEGASGQDLEDQTAKVRNAQDKPKSISETSFKSISGASVSANSSTTRSIMSCDQFTAFEGTASFTALPLQPVPRGIAHSGPITGSASGSCSGPLERGFMSGPLERGFMSGPLERGFMSGPLERDKGGFMSGPLERGYLSGPLDQAHYSGMLYSSGSQRRRKKTLADYVKNASIPMRRALSRTVARTRKSLIAPMRNHAQKRSAESDERALDSTADQCSLSSEIHMRESHNLQWAQGKAGEDRVHIVLSEEHGWMFVGIYDGFNGPDAPDFLMTNLYPEIYKELEGLLWDQKEAFGFSQTCNCTIDDEALVDNFGPGPTRCGGKGLTEKASSNVQHEGVSEMKHSERSDGLKRNGLIENCHVMGVHINPRASSTMGHEEGSAVGLTELSEDRKDWERGETLQNSRKPSADGEHKQVTLKSLLGVKLKQACRRKKKDNYKKLFPWRYDWEQERTESQRQINENLSQEVNSPPIPSRRGRVDHGGVLKALERALEATEQAYMEMTESAVQENPELAVVGSCLLVVLMKDEDVYIMNVGDSRAVLAQDTRPYDASRSSKGQSANQSNESKEDDQERIGARDSKLRMELERIIEETPTELAALEASYDVGELAPPPVSPTLGALQLSSDHSTSIEEELVKIRREHPDDVASIANDRVKGRLKVTRAFGAGFLKQPKLNDALLEMFRIDFIGDAPYITCTPFLQHHRLGPQDQFLVLSSDGLYQYLSNEEVVAHVEWFMEKFPDGDPAQYLIEELLFRAAKKAGMDFHELLDIPQGDRRKYHDDVSVMVISLEGRIWRSSS